MFPCRVYLDKGIRAQAGPGGGGGGVFPEDRIVERWTMDNTDITDEGDLHRQAVGAKFIMTDGFRNYDNAVGAKFIMTDGFRNYDNAVGAKFFIDSIVANVN